MVRVLGFNPDSSLIRYLLPSCILLLGLAYFSDVHHALIPLLPQRDANRRPLLQLLTTSYSADEYYEAPFDGRAFKMPHHYPARIDGYVAPITPVAQGYDGDRLLFGSALSMGEGGEKSRDSLVPRAIYQTWKTDVVGPRMMQALESWIEMNPEYEYLFINDTVAATYVAQYAGPSHSAIEASTKLHHTPGRTSLDSPIISTFVPKGCDHERTERHIAPTSFPLTPAEIREIQDLYLTCHIGATKADILRLLLIYEQGGIYFDADTACARPLREWVHPEASFVTARGGRGDLMQWGIIAAPAHPIIAQVIRAALRSAQQRGDRKEDWVEYVAGPPIYWSGAREVMCNPELGGVIDRMQAYTTDQFAGRATFKASGVDLERHQQGHKHWHDQQGIDRKQREEKEAAATGAAEGAGESA